MKNMFLIVIVGTVTAISILAVIFNTEILGSNATFGECTISASGQDGSYSSSGASVNENQCKKDCAEAVISKRTENRDVFCKFQTISGYGWVSSPEEFEDMIDKLSLNSIH